MTRDEAIYKAQEIFESGTSPRAMADVVDFLVALGLLKFETTVDKDRVAAAERLENMFISVVANGRKCAGQIHVEGAYEILDILTKSGFKITREPGA